MNDWILSPLESVIFIASFLLAIYLCIPKSVVYWHLWKKTGKPIYLSHASAIGILAIFLLVNIFVSFIRTVLGV